MTGLGHVLEYLTLSVETTSTPTFVIRTTRYTLEGQTKR